MSLQDILRCFFVPGVMGNVPAGLVMCYVFAYFTVLTDYHWDRRPFFHHTLLSYAQTMTCRDSY
jgi:hypothetical protein